MSDCPIVQRQLSEFLDGELSPDAHAEVATHLRTCADCAGVWRDLERVVLTGRHLGPIDPPEHIWLEVAGRLRLDAPAPRPTAARRPRSAAWQWIGLSAALVGLTLGLYWLTARQTSPAGPASTAAGSVETVNDELTLALEHYQKAVAELEAVAQSGDGQVDAAVVATVKQNLGAIDQAIAESRAALTSNPESAPAQASLFEALRHKINVLQATVALINEIRQGHPEGAAQAVEGLGKES